MYAGRSWGRNDDGCQGGAKYLFSMEERRRTDMGYCNVGVRSAKFIEIACTYQEYRLGKGEEGGTNGLFQRVGRNAKGVKKPTLRGIRI